MDVLKVIYDKVAESIDQTNKREAELQAATALVGRILDDTTHPAHELIKLFVGAIVKEQLKELMTKEKRERAYQP